MDINVFLNMIENSLVASGSKTSVFVYLTIIFFLLFP
jgi:hypothetical protein